MSGVRNRPRGDLAARLAGPAPGVRDPGASSPRQAPPLPGAALAAVLAAGLEAGLPPERVLSAMAAWAAALDHPRARALASAALDTETATGDRLVDDLALAVTLARRAGVPPAALIRQAGREQARREQQQRRERLSRLPVLLVLPSGLLLLPAAVALGVVPVVVDLLGRVLSG